MSCIFAEVKASCNFAFHVEVNRNYKLARILKFMPFKLYILGRDCCRLRQRSSPSRCVDIDYTKLMISDARMSAK